ncbi:MAG: nucleotidyltransferase family protein [Deltaproteobacteria bacterium]|nr:nucleotidyltransferase family protein [Deltaproteobacteria bacterium]
MTPTLKIPIPTEAIAAFCRKHHIRKLSLFGSVLREDFGPDSDVDVLVEFEPGTRVGLFGLSEMRYELGDLFHRETDLRTPGFLGKRAKERVLREAQRVYEL